MIYLKNTTEKQKLYIPKDSSSIPYSDYYYTKQESDERFASKEDIETINTDIEDLSGDVSNLETKVNAEKTWFIYYEQDVSDITANLTKDDFLYLCETISNSKPVNIIFTDGYQHYPQFFYADYDKEDLANCNIYALCNEDDISSEGNQKVYIRVYWDEETEIVRTECSTYYYTPITDENIDDYAITPGNFNENVSKFGIPLLNVTDSMPTPEAGRGFLVREGFGWVNTQMQNNIVPLFVLKFTGNANYFFVKGFDSISRTSDGKSINSIQYVFTDQSGTMDISVNHSYTGTSAIVSATKVNQPYYFLRFLYPYNSSEPAKTGYDYSIPNWSSILNSTVIIQAVDSTSSARKLYTATGLYRASLITDNRIYFTLEDGTKTVMTLKLGSGDSAQILSWLPVTEEQNEA